MLEVSFDDEMMSKISAKNSELSTVCVRFIVSKKNIEHHLCIINERSIDRWMLLVDVDVVV